MTNKKYRTVLVRIKGLIFGVIMTYICYALNMFLVVSDFLNQGLGDNILSLLISAGASLIFVVGMLTGIILGLRQFFTGKDMFSSVIKDFLSGFLGDDKKKTPNFQPVAKPETLENVIGKLKKNSDEVETLQDDEIHRESSEYQEISSNDKIPKSDEEKYRSDINVVYSEDIKTKTCPKCAEEIRLEAFVCRFCKHEFDEADVQKTIQELEDRKKEDQKKLEADRKKEEESLLTQKTLKMKKAARIKMNMQYGLCALMEVFFVFIGGFFFIMLIIMINNGDLIAAFVPGCFLFFFILAGIKIYRKAKKIKSDLATNVIKEIEDFTVALSK